MESMQRFFGLAVVAMTLMLAAGCAAPKDTMTDVADTVSDAVMDAPAVAIRVNAGAYEPFTDAKGNVWLPDQDKTSTKDWGALYGNTVDRGNIEIKNTEMDKVYQTERFDMESYTFTVPKDMTYTVKLHFAETYDGIMGAGERVFDVKVNGEMAIEGMDPFKEAGGLNAAVVKTVKGVKPDAEGLIKILFVIKTQSPEINGIEIIAE